MGCRGEARGPNSIILLRRRMLYSRYTGPSMENAPFGLGDTRKLISLDSSFFALTLHLDVFNRCFSLDSTAQTVHVMKYIFPREFGLHNVFTSAADPKDNVDLFSNHRHREYEIACVEEQRRQNRCQSSGDQLRAELGGNDFGKLPRRLRGQALELVQRFRVHHARCSYGELLKYYCPEVSSLPQIAHAPQLT